MAWNYRVFRTRFEDGAGGEEDHFTIREAYYDEGSLWGISADSRGSGPCGTTLTEVMKDHARIQEAFTRPVLTPEDVPGYVYEEREVPLADTPKAGPFLPKKAGPQHNISTAKLGDHDDTRYAY